MESKDFDGKEFDFCESELDSLALRGQRAAELEQQAEQMLDQARQLRGQAKAERHGALELAKKWAKVRNGIPAELQVEGLLGNNGLPRGIKVLPAPKTPCDGKDCGEEKKS